MRGKYLRPPKGKIIVVVISLAQGVVVLILGLLDGKAIKYLMIPWQDTVGQFKVFWNIVRQYPQLANHSVYITLYLRRHLNISNIFYLNHDLHDVVSRFYILMMIVILLNHP